MAIAANAFSGIAAILHFKPIPPGMARAGVPESWLTFPIGTLKTAGTAGLLPGLTGVPLIGTAAAIGLILFFVCAIYTHLRASDYSPHVMKALVQAESSLNRILRDRQMPLEDAEKLIAQISNAIFTVTRDHPHDPKDLPEL